jgi:hypothetical protein
MEAICNKKYPAGIQSPLKISNHACQFLPVMQQRPAEQAVAEDNIVQGMDRCGPAEVFPAETDHHAGPRIEQTLHVAPEGG